MNEEIVSLVRSKKLVEFLREPTSRNPNMDSIVGVVRGIVNGIPINQGSRHVTAQEDLRNPSILTLAKKALAQRERVVTQPGKKAAKERGIYTIKPWRVRRRRR